MEDKSMTTRGPTQWREEKPAGLGSNDLAFSKANSAEGCSDRFGYHEEQHQQWQQHHQQQQKPWGKWSLDKRAETAKKKPISLLQNFNMLMCVVNHDKIDFTQSTSHPEPSPGSFLREASPWSTATQCTFGKAELISLSEQVFQWIVFTQMKAVDFPLLRLFG